MILLREEEEPGPATATAEHQHPGCRHDDQLLRQKALLRRSCALAFRLWRFGLGLRFLCLCHSSLPRRAVTGATPRISSPEARLRMVNDCLRTGKKLPGRKHIAPVCAGSEYA